MVATLSADIVKSTSLQTEDLIELRNRLLNQFDELEKDYLGFWARIVKGDGIECFIPEHRYALRIAVLLKLFVKMQADKFNCSEMLQKYGIRFSIGMSRRVYEHVGRIVFMAFDGTPDCWFGEKETAKTEYVLAGTLMSIFIVVMVGLMVTMVAGRSWQS